MAWFWVKMCPFEDALPLVILKKIKKQHLWCSGRCKYEFTPKTILRMKEHPVTHSVLHQALLDSTIRIYSVWNPHQSMEMNT
jgi:hypothetical protein